MMGLLKDQSKEEWKKANNRNSYRHSLSVRGSLLHPLARLKALYWSSLCLFPVASPGTLGSNHDIPEGKKW